jgi:hypothetical protein
MKSSSVCLTLVVNRSIREEFFEYLYERSDLVSGFTASDVEGHGPTVRLHSASEQVKGRADRVLIRVILDELAAKTLITKIEHAFAGSHLVYWITAVLSAGVIE